MENTVFFDLETKYLADEVGGWGNIHFSFTVLGIGLLGGVGVGFAYLVPIATCILWFPRHRGLVTGIAVAGFGGGAALIAQVEPLVPPDTGDEPPSPPDSQP